MSTAEDRPVESSERIARGPIGVAKLVGRLTRAALGARGLAGADIVAQWPAIVGEDLATLATPTSLKRERGSEGGVLHLRVASGAAAMVLQLKGPQIVDRVNRFFGYRAVARLHVVAGVAPKFKPAARPEPSLSPESLQQIERNVAHVQNPELRAALARLGAAVRRRHADDDAAR